MKKSAMIAQLRKEGRRILTEFESKKFLKQAGIPVIETRLARTQKEAILFSQEMGFPVALKIASPDIVHKSDSGGVKLSLNHASDVKAAYSQIMDRVQEKNPSASIRGVSVQKMAKPGTEVIVGASKDPQFGPVIMFGLGGIFVEVLKDVSFRIIPLSRKDALEMIEELKGYPLLQGYRGKEPADLPALIEIILKISGVMEENPEIRELELNPVMAYKKGALAVDARIILEE
ncbi:MAG: acetyl-CoA synthetase [Deltaproteobacteria bacterium RBG_16_49_23]|nr:MAG: acetyl-CoA synthetase [Deltaproteobacteria bacterium RBG_16_49_23]